MAYPDIPNYRHLIDHIAGTQGMPSLIQRRCRRQMPAARCYRSN